MGADSKPCTSVIKNRFDSGFSFNAPVAQKLGMTTTETGKRLDLSQSAVSRSSVRGQQIERENRFELIDQNA